MVFGNLKHLCIDRGFKYGKALIGLTRDFVPNLLVLET